MLARQIINIYKKNDMRLVMDISRDVLYVNENPYDPYNSYENPDWNKRGACFARQIIHIYT